MIVEKWLYKVILDLIDIIIILIIVLLVVGVFIIFLVMLIVGVILNSLVGVIEWILNVGGVILGFVLGLFFLLMVMFGLY